MRTIKFRGKKLHNREWACGYLTDVDNTPIGKVGIINSKPFSGCEESTMVIAETIGQFTGVFDCEGREIYEGEILSACYGHSPNIIEVTGVVEFVHCGFALRFGKDTGVWLDQLIHAEIIGNIYDNPELMEGGEK